MTAFYMFRAMFLTFFGEYRGARRERAGHRDDGMPEPGITHDPWARGDAVPLAILRCFLLSAAGSAFHTCSKDRSLRCLPAPVVSKPCPRRASRSIAAAGCLRALGGTRNWLDGMSVGAALRLVLAWLLYSARRDLPDRLPRARRPLHGWSTTSTSWTRSTTPRWSSRIVDGSRSVLWQGVDAG